MRRLPILLVSLFAIGAFALILSRSVTEFTHRDEHQFIVPGLLTVREGLIPYRDYPLFHMPYLVLVHGVLGMITGWPLLTARILTAAAAWASLVLLGVYAFRRLAPLPRFRWWLALAIPLLLLFEPIFAATVTYAWNHAVPLFFALLAFLLACRALRVTDGRWLCVASGASLAVAACMRLTFLPLLAPFAISLLWFNRSPWRLRWQRAGFFAGGAALAALPAAILFAMAPEQFLFGNLQYPKLSVIWRRYPIWKENLSTFVDPVRGFLDPLHEGLHGRTLDRKLRRTMAVTVRDNWPVFAAIVGSLVTGAIGVARTRRAEPALGFLAVTLPFVVWGCMAPSRFHVQYFFALMPFLALAMVELCRATALWRPVAGAASAGLILASALMAAVLGASQYACARQLRDFASWGAVNAHRLAYQLRAELGPGRILTLDPLLVAEAGAPVYPEVSSGEFGWRTAHLLPLEKRRRLKMVCAFDLEPWLRAQPPNALLLDWTDPQLTPPLIAWARTHGFHSQNRYGLLELWTRPSLPP
jgi:4-amino-4-deoxy-L-arabinose transferase-like glycosyltransferase